MVYGKRISPAVLVVCPHVRVFMVAVGKLHHCYFYMRYKHLKPKHAVK